MMICSIMRLSLVLFSRAILLQDYSACSSFFIIPSVTPALHIIVERSDRSILLGCSLSLFLDIKALSSGLSVRS